jgi:hypothetical protein
MLARGGVSASPDWARSGTHYLHVTNESGHFVIEDRSAKEGFARVIAIDRVRGTSAVQYYLL